jgi:hypothetical protein
VSDEITRTGERNRCVVLLKATLEILRKADEGPFVHNVLELTAHYDGTECDGLCLKDDIENLLEELGELESAP